MTEVAVQSPDERALSAHLRSARFQAGVDAGSWRLISLSWPNAMIAVAAAERAGAPTEFVLRFDLSGYPQRGPTAALWDVATNTVLSAATRPKGERAGSIFRGDWNGGIALYAPWDRIALESHPDWAQRYPLHAWNPRRDLTFFLTNVFDVLSDDAYMGI